MQDKHLAVDIIALMESLVLASRYSAIVEMTRIYDFEFRPDCYQSQIKKNLGSRVSTISY